MGTALSRFRSNVPTAAPRAAAAVKFPPTPAVPSSYAAAAPLGDELQRNQAVTDLLNTTTIVTHTQPAPSDVSSGAKTVGVQQAEGTLSAEQLARMLAEHARRPHEWPVEALAKQYDVSNVAALESALLHVQPYRVEEDAASGRLRALPIEAAGAVEVAGAGGGAGGESGRA